MTPIEMAKKCKEAIESGGDGKILLQVPGYTRGARIRLDRVTRRKCPMGDIVQEMADPPRTLAFFDAIEVLAWLVASGAIDARDTLGGEE